MQGQVEVVVNEWFDTTEQRLFPTSSTSIFGACALHSAAGKLKFNFFACGLSFALSELYSIYTIS